MHKGMNVSLSTDDPLMLHYTKVYKDIFHPGHRSIHSINQSFIDELPSSALVLSFSLHLYLSTSLPLCLAYTHEAAHLLPSTLGFVLLSTVAPMVD